MKESLEGDMVRPVENEIKLPFLPLSLSLSLSRSFLCEIVFLCETQGAGSNVRGQRASGSASLSRSLERRTDVGRDFFRGTKEQEQMTSQPLKHERVEQSEKGGGSR